MKVYIPFIGFDYDGDDVLGVYSTRAKAQERLDRGILGGGTGDTNFIKEYEIDIDDEELT